MVPGDARTASCECLTRAPQRPTLPTRRAAERGNGWLATIVSTLAIVGFVVASSEGSRGFALRAVCAGGAFFAEAVLSFFLARERNPAILLAAAADVFFATGW